MNDYIINVFSSKKAIESWDEAYSVRNPSGSDTYKITKDILSQKYKTIITITKDKELARSVKELTSTNI